MDVLKLTRCSGTSTICYMFFSSHSINTSLIPSLAVQIFTGSTEKAPRFSGSHHGIVKDNGENKDDKYDHLGCSSLTLRHWKAIIHLFTPDHRNWEIAQGTRR